MVGVGNREGEYCGVSGQDGSWRKVLQNAGRCNSGQGISAIAARAGIFTAFIRRNIIADILKLPRSSGSDIDRNCTTGTDGHGGPGRVAKGQGCIARTRSPGRRSQTGGAGVGCAGYFQTSGQVICEFHPAQRNGCSVIIIERKSQF